MRELTHLRDLLTALPLTADTPAVQAAATARQTVVDEIDGLFDAATDAAPALPMPVVVAVLGPSGAGKSTLVNRLVGEDVVPTAETRPTTTRPVWVCSQADVAVVSHHADGTVTPTTALPAGLVLAEYPDPGVLDTESGSRAEGWSAAPSPAGLSLVVVSPTRYADRRVWTLLKSLSGIGGADAGRVAVVVTRFPADPDAAAPMVSDLMARLAAHGLDDVMVVALPDDEPDGLGPTGAEAVAGLRDSLWAYAGYHLPVRADVVAQQVADDAAAAFLADLDQRLAPILTLEEHGTTADQPAGRPLREIDVDRSTARWADEAWRVCREDAQTTAVLTALRADGPQPPPADLQQAAQATWEHLPQVLGTATRRHTRTLQRSLAADTVVVTPGRASAHIAALEEQSLMWLRESIAALDDVVGLGGGVAVEALALALVLDAIRQLGGEYDDPGNRSAPHGSADGDDKMVLAGLLRSSLGAPTAAQLRATCGQQLETMLTRAISDFAAPAADPEPRQQPDADDLATVRMAAAALSRATQSALPSAADG